MHIVGFGATNDTSIGKGCAVDLDRYFFEMQAIAGAIGYGEAFYSAIGDQCSKEHLQQVLGALECGKDDIVVFYYTGHGTREFGDTSEFPQMCMNASDKGGYVPVRDVINKVKASKARLKIVLTDCCNMPRSHQSGQMHDFGNLDQYFTTSDLALKNYRKLFVEEKGVVAVTSCKAGEVSTFIYERDEKGRRVDYRGSVFSLAFYAALTDISLSNQGVTWGNLLKHVNDKMKYIVVPSQTAVWEISLESSVSNEVLPPTLVMAEDKKMAKDIAMLLDRKKPLDQRLGKVDVVMKRWFTADAKVASMARDGRMVLDYYEDVRKFLRHITISDGVARLIVLRGHKAATGKWDYIELQEVRNQ